LLLAVLIVAALQILHNRCPVAATVVKSFKKIPRSRCRLPPKSDHLFRSPHATFPL